MVKKTTKKTTRRKKLRISIPEFQSWLSGVIEFQDKDWTPNKEQWKAILTKINNLEVEKAEIIREVHRSKETPAPILDNVPVQEFDRMGYPLQQVQQVQEVGLLKNKPPNTVIKATSDNTIVPNGTEILQSSTNHSKPVPAERPNGTIESSFK